MLPDSDPIDLTQLFCDPRSLAANSGNLKPGVEPGRWTAESDESVIRYRVANIGLPPDSTHFFFHLQVSLNQLDCAITAISLVNGAVSDGRVWHPSVRDADGEQDLTGVIACDGDGLTVYSNIRGPGEVTFDIRRLVLWPIPRRQLAIAFVVDPWIERRPINMGRGELVDSWKADYLWWFANILQELKKAGANFTTTVLIGEGHVPALAANRDKLDALDADIRVMQLDDLLEAAGGQRRGLHAQRARDFDKNEAEQNRIVSLYRKYLPQAPDLLFCISDIQAVARAFDTTMVLYRDAIYARTPFPDEMTSFDTDGLYKNSGISSLCQSPAPRQLSADIVDFLLPREESIEALLTEKGLLASGFLLLPLQDSDHINFWDESPFGSQLELVVAAARRFPDQSIVVTHHPEAREISRETMADLARLLPNLVELEELAGTGNVTARLLPFASGLVAVSSGLIFQAILRDVPVHLMGRHGLESLLRKGVATKGVAWHLLTRVFFSYGYLLDGRWFWARLIALGLFRQGRLTASALAIDFPDSVFDKLLESRRAVTPAILRPSAAARGIFLGNDTSNGHAGCRAVMASLNRILRDAGRTVIGRHRCGETEYDLASLERADLVVVNGEGTFHDNTTDAQALAGLLRAAGQRNKRYWLVNCTLQNLAPEFEDLVRGAERVITREARSHAYACLLNRNSELRIDCCVEAPFHNVRTTGMRSGVVFGLVHPDSAFHAGMRAHELQNLSRVVLEFPHDGRDFADIVAELSKFEFYVTGQYHGVYAAVLAATPFLPIPGNTHKIEGLLEWAGVDIPFFDPSKKLANQLEMVRDRAAEYQKLRAFVLSTASLRTADFL